MIDIFIVYFQYDYGNVVDETFNAFKTIEECHEYIKKEGEGTTGDYQPDIWKISSNGNNGLIAEKVY